MLRAYMQDPITVIFNQSHNQFGEPVVLPDVTMNAYVDWKTHLVRNIEGEQVVSRGIVYIIYKRKLTHKDRIKISGVKYIILDVQEAKDFSENHQEVHLQ